MQKPLMTMGLAAALSSPAFSKELSKEEFKAYIAEHCSRPSIRCDPEMRADTVVGFTYEGNGHKDYFWLSYREWNQFEKKHAIDWLPRRHTVTAVSRPVGRPYIMNEKPYTRLDELETEKYRLQTLQGVCALSFASCSYGFSKMVGFWPGYVVGLVCTAGAFGCTVVAQNRIEKINKEIDVIEAGGHAAGGASSGSSWVSGSFDPHAMPPLPPLPAGHVTIIDHPYIP